MRFPYLADVIELRTIHNLYLVTKEEVESSERWIKPKDTPSFEAECTSLVACQRGA